MKKLFIGFLILLNTNCAYTIFAPPKVLYTNEGSIGVKYGSAGVQSIGDSEKAMELISDHCKGKYRITNRTVSDGFTTVDAICE